MSVSSRRGFLLKASALAAAPLSSLPPAFAAGQAPETAKVRLIHAQAMCLAPQYLAADLLRADGFDEVEYVSIADVPGVESIPEMLAAYRADFSMDGAPTFLPYLDTGNGVVVLCGIHAGCYELYAQEHIRSIRDLRGKRIAVSRFQIERYFMSSMMAYVGVDPRRDIHWVTLPSFAESMRLYVGRKVDAFLAFPPQPQELRRKGIGHVLLSTTHDRPWSQYFCCMLGGARDFVSKYPVATKRVVRAYLMATQMCVSDPERVARYMVAQGHVSDYEYAIGLLRELPYSRWREANPEDTLRFHALRLHEVGMIRSAPNRLIARSTDWSFLSELKSELKT